MTSTSNSSSIRNIENQYGINLTTCSRAELDALTSAHSAHRTITKLSELMLDDHKFDIENMTEVERGNLKYLVMSTEEIIDVVNKKTKTIYFLPRYKRLRFLMSYEDFYQTCAHKLLLNDGILKFDANYKLGAAIQFWFDRVAGWKCIRKANIADEIAIIDSPCNDDSETTMGDFLLKDLTFNVDTLPLESKMCIDHILKHMDKGTNSKIVLKAGATEIPMSEYTIAKLFLKFSLGKKELSKMMYNTVTNKLVSNQIFNKFYKRTLVHIAEVLNKEANLFGEKFTINEDEL